MTNHNLSNLRIETLEIPSCHRSSCDKIRYVNQLDVTKSSQSIDDDLASNNVSNESGTDLIAGVYEGGFKIWECSYDLLTYLQELVATNDSTFSHVLDLGCGAGLLGIFTAIKGAESVVFQDYNKAVIQGVTIPNYLANTESHPTLKCQTKFISGPWETMCNSVVDEKEQFDLILTSETIYNISHYSHLLEIFDHALTRNGRILLAAKVNYFGVGGGLRQFEAALNDANKKHLKWAFRTVKIIDENVKREILEIRRKE